MSYITKTAKVIARVLGAVISIERPADDNMARYPYYHRYG